ncbi:MAG TPA: YggS family pyridoxal phosphate-dependent enzyme [Terriglobales bacterium]|nr:YggS family pyridoxal phosphate-dependent enzyme [Terriglobales bacterium]
MSIADNLARVHQRIADAARRAGRRPEEIALMAVTKTFPPEIIRQAYAAGQRLFGENRVQEFADKAPSLTDLPGIEFHLIGHLQSNKAAKAAQIFAGIDSVDSLHLAERLNTAAGKAGKRLPVLIEINVGGEDAKSGIRVPSAPDSDVLEELLEAAARLDYLEFRGFMTIPPFTQDPEGARPYFRLLRRLRDQIAARKVPAVSMDVLSMGMSHDFEIAIEEGSTCVRVGTAIFGPRPGPGWVRGEGTET